MLEEFDIFPTKFFTTRIDDDNLLSSLTQEVYDSKEEIKKLSWATQEQSCENYITDYCKPKKYEAFGRVADLLKNIFSESGLEFDLYRYWTALYKKYSIHEMHSHKSSILLNPNYSGILYMSNVGDTNFFSTNPSSFNNTTSIKSEHGRIVMFPANVPHQVVTNFDSDVERCVIAFNFRLSEK